MAAILHRRFSDNVVRIDGIAARRAPGAGEPLLRVWSVGRDGALACRWTPAPMVRRNPARGPAA
jgi:hypothetical protein